MNEETGPLMFLAEEDILSLERTREEGKNDKFLEEINKIYEEVKKLKKNISKHKKKKLALHQQMARIKITFQEYVKSIEEIEDSEIYKRTIPKEMFRHSRIMNYCYLFMIPEIDVKSKVDENVLTSIRKVLAEHKRVWEIHEELMVLEKNELQQEKYVSEVEKRFEIYEKKVNYVAAKMEFSMAVNKVSLELKESIFQEIEQIYNSEIEHSKLCLSIKEIREYQYNTTENATVPLLIEKEISTFKKIAPEEFERQKRRVSNEYRPYMGEYENISSLSSLQRRRIPRTVGFLHTEIDQKLQDCIHAKVLLNSEIYRAILMIYKTCIIIHELTFGWKIVILREDIFYFNAAQGKARIEAKNLVVTFFCTSKDALILKDWVYNLPLYRSEGITLGCFNQSLSQTVSLFFDSLNRAPNTVYVENGYFPEKEIEEQSGIRKREFTKRMHIGKTFFFRAGYREISLLEKKTEDQVVFLFLTEIKPFFLFPTFSGISRIVFKKMYIDEKETIYILYSYRKTSSKFLQLLCPLIVKNFMCKLFAIEIKYYGGEVLYTPEINLQPFMLLGTAIAIFSVLIMTKQIQNIFSQEIL